MIRLFLFDGSGQDTAELRKGRVDRGSPGLIQGTFQGMKDQGAKPDFVLVFIGPRAEALATLGVRQEVCSVAMRVFGIDNNTILPGMNLVSDGLASLTGYQAQGYHLLPVL